MIDNYYLRTIFNQICCLITKVQNDSLSIVAVALGGFVCPRLCSCPRSRFVLTKLRLSSAFRRQVPSRRTPSASWCRSRTRCAPTTPSSTGRPRAGRAARRPGAAGRGRSRPASPAPRPRPRRPTPPPDTSPPRARLSSVWVASRTRPPPPQVITSSRVGTIIYLVPYDA